jgi:uncharacterized protein YfaS (alpha-2-macroglobulin family)
MKIPDQNRLTRVMITSNILEIKKSHGIRIKEINYDKVRIEISELVNRQIEQIEIKDQIYRDYYK